MWPWLGVDWQAVEAIGTGLAALVVIVAGVIALGQLAEAKNARNAAVALQMFDKLANRETKKILAEIYQLPDDKVPDTMTRDVSYVLDTLELLGLFVVEGVIEEDLAIREMRGMEIRVWYKLREYIMQERKNRGHYAQYTEYYAHKSLRYQYFYVPKEQWTRLKGKDLVTALKDQLLESRNPPK